MRVVGQAQSIRSSPWRPRSARLHLSPHVWKVADMLADQQHARVVVGSRLGAGWLDEVADYEAGTPAQGPGVTWLAPPGTVKPAWVEAGRPRPRWLHTPFGPVRVG